MGATLPPEIIEQILSSVPFPTLVTASHSSKLLRNISLHLLSRTQCDNNYLVNWHLNMTDSNGTQAKIPIDLTGTKEAYDWEGVYDRIYIFEADVDQIVWSDGSGELSLNFNFSDGHDEGTYDIEHLQEDQQIVAEISTETTISPARPTSNEEMSDSVTPEIYPATLPWSDRTSNRKHLCTGLIALVLYPWSTAPQTRVGPLGQVSRWRTLYEVNLTPPPLLPGKIITEDSNGVMYWKRSIKRVRVAISWSLICAEFVWRKRVDVIRKQRESGPVKDGIEVDCVCRCVDWERESTGIKVVRLDEIQQMVAWDVY